MTAKIPTLFFDPEGRGPVESELWITRHGPKRDGDLDIIGLQVAESNFDGDVRHIGGYMLSPETATALHRQLGRALGIADQRALLQRCRDVLAAVRLLGADHSFREALPYLIRDLETAIAAPAQEEG